MKKNSISARRETEEADVPPKPYIRSCSPMYSMNVSTGGIMPSTHAMGNKSIQILIP